MNIMSGSAAKEASKWDMVADIIKNHAQPREADQSCHDKETGPGWESSRSAGSHAPSWPGTEADNNTTSKDSSGWTKWETLPGNKDDAKTGQIIKHGKEISPATRTDFGDRNWGKGITPGSDTWRRRSRSPSPRSGWSRSHRNRSRSPSHGFRHEHDGWNERSRSSTGGSAEPCRHFASGRCRIGSQCRFLHQDGHSYDDQRYGGGAAESWGGRQEKGGSLGHVRNETFNDSNGQDQRSDGHRSRYDGHREKHESHRSNRSSDHCKNFLRGRCDRGSTCRFVHDGASADGHNEWSSKTGKREREDGMQEPDNFRREWRREPRRNNDIPCKYFAGGHCLNGENCKFSHQVPDVDGPEGWTRDNKSHHDLGNENRSWDGPKWNEKAGVQNVDNSPPWRSNNNGARVSAPESRPWDGPKWSDLEPGKNTSNSPQWRSNNSIGWGVPKSTVTINKVPDGAGISYNTDTEESGCNPQDLQSRNPGEDNYQHVATGMIQPVASESAYIQQHSGQNEPNQQFTSPPSVQSFNENAQNLNPNEQNQQIFPPIGNGQNFSPNGLRQQMKPQPPVKKFDLVDGNMPSTNSGMPITSAATIEQVPQVTNLSASLAQIFGNEGQLPQLYASLNHLSTTEAVPGLPYSHLNAASSLAPTAAPHALPNQLSFSQEQYDPIHDSIEPAKLDLNEQPPGFPLKPHEQKSIAEETQGSIKSLAASAASKPNDGDCHSSGDGMEKNLHHENREIKSQDTRAKVADEEVMDKREKEHQTGETEKERQTGHTKDMNADGEADEEAKRSKDEKGMRLFKFALVESVKELLKPAWKEGHLSREAHKTIVKKVVDKVTDAIQGPHIPQTQEKIDHYLLHSKSKLTKLVQAYVGKYSKS